MRPLNDDELKSLLKQAKSKPPQPRSELAVRVLRAYEANVAKTPNWRRLLLRPVPIPLPIGMLAAVLLVLIGAVIGFGVRRPTVIVQGHGVEVPVTREQDFRDSPAGQQESIPPIANLTFKEFQPVRQIRPHVVRSSRDDQ